LPFGFITDKVQASYVHGVPKKDSFVGVSDALRLAVVCRKGMLKRFTKDSGQPVTDLSPRAIVGQTFGQMEGLTEGATYVRRYMIENGAHRYVQSSSFWIQSFSTTSHSFHKILHNVYQRSPQGGISGNKKDGCDAIVVSGVRQGGFDSFDKLVYVADTQAGAGGLLTSMEKKLPIRVFRSSKLDNLYVANLPEKKESAQYRYDGLYQVEGLSFDDESGIEKRPHSVSPLVKGRPYKFQLGRVEVGNDNMSNRMSTYEMMDLLTEQLLPVPPRRMKRRHSEIG
jgi:SAD/SRA domain